jgi:hypothetical protein
MNKMRCRRVLYLTLVAALIPVLACSTVNDILINMEATLAASSGYDWYVSTDGDDTYACNTPIRPCRTVEGAVEKASAGHSIYIAAGTYSEPRSPGERIEINLDLTLQGAGAGLTILDFTGSGNGIHIGGEADAAILDMTIQNAVRSDTSPYGGDCIGVEWSAKKLTLQNVTVQKCGTNGVSVNNGPPTTVQISMKNVALSENGQYGISQYRGSLVMEDSAVRLNELSGVFLYNVSLASTNTTVAENHNHGIEFWGGTANLDGASIVNNGGGPSGAFLSGGTGLSVAKAGMYIGDTDMGADVTVTNSLFAGNVDGVDLGGRNSRLNISNTTIKDHYRIGIKISTGSATADNVTLQNNGTVEATLDSLQAQAGGVWVNINGNLELINSQVLDNNGGVSVWGTRLFRGTASIVSTTISYNHGNAVGGVFNKGTVMISLSTIDGNQSNSVRSGVRFGGVYNGGDMKIINSTISGNHGAGIWETWEYEGVSDALTLRFVTVANNEGQGIAVFSGTPLIVENSLVGLNGGNGCYSDATAGVARYATSMDTDGTCGGLTFAPDLLRLGPLADNGGSTQTHALLEGSRAIDAATGDCLPTDQRGVGRPAGGGCDIGAYEYGQAAAPTPVSAQGVVTSTLTPSPTPVPQLPTITRDTLCWEGPGAAYEVVSSIPAGTVVQLLGVGKQKGWYVINNPRYQVPCWVSEENISVPPNTNLRVFPVPPIPTPTLAFMAPRTPSKLSANTTACSANEYVVTITWKDNAANETGYRVYRDGQVIAELGPNASSYVDNPPYSGPHTYMVEAFNAVGASASNSDKDSGCVY